MTIGTPIAPRRLLLIALAIAAIPIAPVAAAAEDVGPAVYLAADTIAAEPADDKTDAAACLVQLGWQPGEFQVRVEAAPRRAYDFLVRFPSPHASGNAINDMVAMEWYPARDSNGELVTAPAIVVVHESGSAMEIGQLFARSLQLKGLHAFMIQLPYYGERRGDSKGPPAEGLLATMRQGIADVRRAYDAVAAIPEVDRRLIGLQGTSLGGFVSATAGSVDGCYDRVFIMLAGGNLAAMVENGEKDTAKFRQKLVDAGLSADEIRELLWQVEPTRIAHRLPPTATWLYSAMYDRVVPLEHGTALAAAIGLPPEHHVRLPGNHYSTIVYFPWIVNHIAARMRADREAAPAQKNPKFEARNPK